MADPLSITAGVVCLRLLLNTIDTIKQAPSVIANIKDDLQSVDAVLRSLNKTLEDESLPESYKSQLQDMQIRNAVANCSKASEAFDKRLKHWMRHSSEKDTFWWDRVRAGYFGEARIQTFRTQLDTCKSTISMALGTANFLNSCRLGETTDETKALILMNKENEAKDRVMAVDRQIAETNTQLQQLSVDANEQRGGETAQSRSELLDEMRQLLDFLNEYRNICIKAQSKIHHERSQQTITNVTMTSGGRMMVGFINTDGEESGTSQSITDVTAESGGYGIVGVANNVNVSDFFPK